MSSSMPPYRSSAETESIEAPVQFFECEPVPIPPGTKARPRKRAGQRPSTGWFLAGSGAVAAALLIGLVLGRAILTGPSPPPGPGELLLASVTAQYKPDRAGQPAERVGQDPQGVYRITRDSFDLVLRGPRKGFAAVVLILFTALFRPKPQGASS